MRVLSERFSPAARAAYLLKIAVCTIPRCGIAAITFLFLGIFALFPACTQYKEYQTIQNTPIQTRAAVLGDGVSIEDVLTIDGVKAATPVLRIDAQFTGNEYRWSGQIQAIDSHFLNIQIKEGQLFPAQSNMPVLLVNPASGFSYGETIRIQINGRDWTALVCGILDDGSPEPTAYMSYMTAASIWPQPQCTEILLRLSGKAQLTEASAQLQKYGILVETEPNLEGNSLNVLREARFLLALGIIFLVCSLVLLRGGQRLEYIKHRDELLALSAPGNISFKLLLRLRNATLAFLSILFAAAAAAVLNYFSLQAIVMGITVVFLCFFGRYNLDQYFFGM